LKRNLVRRHLKR